MKPTLQATEAIVLACINGQATSQDALNAVVRYQFAWNEPLRRYWLGRGFNPADYDVSRDGSIPGTIPMDAVPGVPTDVFRHVTLVSSERPATQVFRTSGTTSGARGQAHRISTAAYDHGATVFFESFFGAGIAAPSAAVPALVFAPPDVPDSSLSHMVRVLAERAGAQVTYAVHPDAGLDLDALCTALPGPDGEPFTLFGTAFAFVFLFDALADQPERRAELRLPPGSRIIETGGYKGRSRTLDKPELYQTLAEVFGVPVTEVHSEYSMTELSSQLYSRPWNTQGVQQLVPPHWCHVSAVDPETLAPLPNGQTGLLRFVDLANVDTVVAIQTSDIGHIEPDGAVILQGRSPGAVPRGCSLAIEEVLATAASRRREAAPNSEERST